MSSLLSSFNFGQKHAYFHAKITIHELTNVPLVTGNFKTRWRVKNHHNLQSIPFSQGDNQNDRDTPAGSEDGGERRSLQHKKSFASSIASQDNTTPENATKGLSTSSKSEYKATLKSDLPRERKTSNRFLSGFKDAFQNKGRKSSSTHESSKESHTTEEEDYRYSEEGKEISEKNTGGSSKHESHDSSRFEKPKRQGSFTDSIKITSLSSKTFDEKDVSHQNSSSNPFSFLHLESRGETTNEKVKDHTVKWERTIDMGLRVAVEKQRVNEKSHSGTPAATASGAITPSGQGPPGSSDGHSFSAPGNRSSFGGDFKAIPSSRSVGDLKNEHGESKGEKQEREAKEKDREMTNAWGMLGNTEMKITIKAEIATETGGHHHSSDSHMTIGYIVINLGEFAPYPESNAHHHHQLHHHHALSHYHHQHHQHSHHSMTLSRAETRRYLLTNSRINATLKMTIEMTHVGGTKEYAVPAIRRGLIVTGVSSLIDTASHAGGSGPNSEAGYSAEGHGNERSKTGHGNDGRYTLGRNPSVSSVNNEQMSAWPTNSVARHVRIPSSNLRTEVSHHDAARAVKEAGGQRMGFSFGAGAHHERPPEDVIDALFSATSPNSLSSMLTPNRSDNVKQKTSPSRKKNRESENEETPREKKSDDKIERGVLPERPAHFDGLAPAEHPKDSAQTTGSSLSRFSFDNGMTTNRPGIDMPHVEPLTEQRRESKSSEGHSDEINSTHRRNSSGNTMRSILANSTSSKASRRPSNSAAPPSSSSIGGLSSQDSANFGKQSHSSGLSHKVNLVHWDASVSHDSHDSHEQDPLSPPASANLTIPTARLTTSPSIMSRKPSDEVVSPIESVKKSSNIGSRKSPFHNRNVEEEEDELEKGGEERTHTQALTPPATPPDVERRNLNFALDNKNKESDNATRRVKGLTREEALQKGYRGAGWGIIPSMESGPYNFSRGVYSESNTPSPFSQSRDAVSS